MRIPSIRPILRSTAFRATALFASAFTCCFVVLFAFIYWQTTLFETARIDRFLVKQVQLIGDAPPHDLLWIVQSHVAADLHRVTFAAVFDADGRMIAGNVEQVPDGLPPDGRTHWVDMQVVDMAAPHTQRVIAAARRLSDGRTLVIGRDIEELSNLRQLVARALALGVIPAVLLALGAGAWVGHQTSARIRIWQRILDRLREGRLGERLPVHGRNDDIDRLAESVNHMLDELERLFDELHNVGNNIAHDLRTPLARIRTQLERTRREAQSQEDMDRLIDKMLGWLDQSIAITTSLLRIAEIEGGRRRDAFAPVRLDEIAREVADFYEPAAEQKQISLRQDLRLCVEVVADHDLMFEAIANLVDNAIKFTPEGGQVGLDVYDSSTGPQLRVSDTGPGIPTSARSDVFKRFFRFERSRYAPGIGLGLSLVAAIVKLHGYTLAIEDGHPGCVVILTCASGRPPTAPDPAHGRLADATR